MRTAVLGVLVAGVLAFGAYGVDEEVCLPCLQAPLSIELPDAATPPDRGQVELPGAESQESQEWQCIVVDIIMECVDYDTDPCAYCYYPCIGGCGVVCEAGVIATCTALAAAGYPTPSWCKYLGIGCIYGCDFICNTACPQCEHCVEYDVTYVYSCGWVFTE